MPESRPPRVLRSTFPRLTLTSALARLAAVLAATLVLPAAAEAATCASGSGTMTVTLVAGETATVSTSAGALTLNNLPCVGGPTASGTNTITITGTTGNETAVIDLSNGPLGPGPLPLEGSGVSEIEINAALGLGSGDRVTVNGSTSADELVIGTAGINLNGDDDADITLSGVENYTANGADGDDLVSAAGGQGTGSALTSSSTLQGDQGADALASGLGNDTIGGGPETDTVSFAAATGGVTASLAVSAAQNTGGAGTDTITNVENADGTTFDDALTGDGSANLLSGSDGDDRLTGGLGDDTLSGGNGSDTADYNSSPAVTVALDQVIQDTIGAGTDTLLGFENLTGGSGADTLSGDGGANAIRSLGGNDIVNGRGGDDGLDGGTGTDTVSLESAVSGTTIDLEAERSVGDGTDSLVSFESATGSPFNDVLIGTDLSNTLDGALGEDTVDYSKSIGGVSLNLQSNVVTGAGGTDTLAEIENAAGSPYDDVLVGSTRANTLQGGMGDDTLNGAGANDMMNGGGGSDTVDYTAAVRDVQVDLTVGEAHGARGDDTLVAIENALTGTGNDFLRGTTGVNTLDGGSGNDRIEGGSGDDNLDGGSDTDTVDFSSSTARVRVNLTRKRALGAGKDELIGFEDARGGSGADFLTGDGAANRVDGGSGNDVLRGKGGDDTLIGGPGRDTVDYSGFAPITEDKGVVVNLARGRASGEGADDLGQVESVIGSGAGDHITGNRRANRLSGGPGGDTLIGGSGRDRLYGGSGDDRLFSRDRRRDRIDGGSGRDRGAADRFDRRRSIERLTLPAG